MRRSRVIRPYAAWLTAAALVTGLQTPLAAAATPHLGDGER